MARLRRGTSRVRQSARGCRERRTGWQRRTCRHWTAGRRTSPCGRRKQPISSRTLGSPNIPFVPYPCGARGRGRGEGGHLVTVKSLHRTWVSPSTFSTDSSLRFAPIQTPLPRSPPSLNLLLIYHHSSQPFARHPAALSEAPGHI